MKSIIVVKYDNQELQDDVVEINSDIEQLHDEILRLLQTKTVGKAHISVRLAPTD